MWFINSDSDKCLKSMFEFPIFFFGFIVRIVIEQRGNLFVCVLCLFFFSSLILPYCKCIL